MRHVPQWDSVAKLKAGVDYSTFTDEGDTCRHGLLRKPFVTHSFLAFLLAAFRRHFFWSIWPSQKCLRRQKRVTCKGDRYPKSFSVDKLTAVADPSPFRDKGTIFTLGLL